MRQYVGTDGYRRQVINGDIFILQEVFNSRHIALREAKDYLVRAKVRLVNGGDAEGCYGTWTKEDSK